MNIVFSYKHNMLQIALFPERDDYYRSVETLQCKASPSDIQVITSMLKSARVEILDSYEGWEIGTEEHDRKERAFKSGMWSVHTSYGWVFLTHRHRVIHFYMSGQSLTLNISNLEYIIKQMERV